LHGRLPAAAAVFLACSGGAHPNFVIYIL
jgi:hypothetical protein